jgi:hypothetical protein
MLGFIIGQVCTVENTESLEGLVQLKRLDGCDMKGRLRNMSHMDQSALERRVLLPEPLAQSWINNSPI